MHILSTQEFEKKTYPTLDDLHNVIKEIITVLDELTTEGILLGASSYGSFFHPKGNPNFLSDIDWIIIFKNFSQLLQNKLFQELLNNLREKNIPFYNPILSQESIQLDNHIISPILHGIKQSTKRKIHGIDPVDIFLQYGVRKNDFNIIWKLFSTFTRYFHEIIVLHNKSSLNDHIQLLQLSLGFYHDTFRSMIVAICDKEDFETELNYEIYMQKFLHKINDDILEIGLEIEHFKNNYLDHVQNYSSVLVYEKFLIQNHSLPHKIAKFSLENISYFKHQILNDI